MTKKDLFRLIIKIFGLYSIITTIFSALPSNISWVIMQIDITGIIWLIGTVVVIVLLFMFLVYKPDKIIGWLNWIEDLIAIRLSLKTSILRIF
jgi:hypothetical protein